ncbi:hypothetical protein WKI68_39940 [Streptomyces sp. MS1.HAVA.3]|uniref:Secreted protein n=1 Tax=Streptomyces caledonius TaxID=3134107 RepID=A0ABU8UCV2_9ACTN
MTLTTPTEQPGGHWRNHAPAYVGLAAVLGTVLAGHLQAQSVLETGRLQAKSATRQVAGTLDATNAQIEAARQSDRVHEQVTRYGELIQASTRMRFLMLRFERLDEAGKRDPAVISELTKDTPDLAAKANSAAVILGGHTSESVRRNSHGIAFTLPYTAQCLETARPGSTSGYRVDYPDRGPMDCAELRRWLEGHEKALAKEPPTFS